MNIKRTNSDDPDFHRLVVDLDKYLAEVDGDQHSYYAQFNGIAEIPNVVVAYEGDEPIGCGAFKRYDDSTVEIKRMYVAPNRRGKARRGADPKRARKMGKRVGVRFDDPRDGTTAGRRNRAL
jgi:hypothetical protein